MSVHPSSTPRARPLEPNPPLSALEMGVELVVQAAVRFFFIYLSTAMASAMVPIRFQAVILPIVTFGTTFMAAFFYQEVKLDPDTRPPKLDLSRSNLENDHDEKASTPGSQSLKTVGSLSSLGDSEASL